MLTKACEFSSSQLTSISLYNWHSDLSNKSKKIRNIFLVFDHCCFPRVSYYDYVAWSARYIVGIIFLKKCSGNKSSYKQKVESRSCKNNSLWISNARFLKKNIDNLEEKKNWMTHVVHWIVNWFLFYNRWQNWYWYKTHCCLNNFIFCHLSVKIRIETQTQDEKSKLRQLLANYLAN